MIGDNSKTGASESTIRVEIYNQTYSIRSDGDNEYILRLAEYVDRKMREISSGTMTVDSLKVAILAALCTSPTNFTNTKALMPKAMPNSLHEAPNAPNFLTVF